MSRATDHASGTATLTSRNQLTIPAAVAKRVGLKRGDRLLLVVDRQGRVTPRQMMASTDGPFV